jgi:phage-related minor tail protein
LGEHKGELKGAKEAYDALREGLQGAINVPANVPALPPSPTLDQILNAVKHVTDDVKATYAELKDTITKANELIDQLKGELDVLGRKLGYAVDGLTMLTFAGTGFLVGGPVGAAAGALAGAALSIFG